MSKTIESLLGIKKFKSIDGAMRHFSDDLAKMHKEHTKEQNSGRKKDGKNSAR